MFLCHLKLYHNTKQYWRVKLWKCVSIYNLLFGTVAVFKLKNFNCVQDTTQTFTDPSATSHRVRDHAICRVVAGVVRDEEFNPLPRFARYTLATATTGEQNIFSPLFPLLDRDRVINTWLTGSAPLSFILILAPVWCGSKTGYNKETSHKPETFIPTRDLGTDWMIELFDGLTFAFPSHQRYFTRALRVLCS